MERSTEVLYPLDVLDFHQKLAMEKRPEGKYLLVTSSLVLSIFCPDGLAHEPQ
jgi:hypothetical protein